MKIDTNLVVKLRKLTGMGIMDCKKILIASNGDFEKAIINVKKYKNRKEIEDRLNSTSQEGIIIIESLKENHSSVILEINSETDFSSRNEKFIKISKQIAKTALHTSVNNIFDLLNINLLEDKITVKEKIKSMIIEFGENIKINRMKKISCSNGILGKYVHNFKIGAIVCLNNGNNELAKNIAIHIVANNPLVINKHQIPKTLINEERKIFEEQIKLKRISEKIYQNIIDGKLHKFISNNNLLDQIYVKDSTKTINELVAEYNATILNFVRFEVSKNSHYDCYGNFNK